MAILRIPAGGVVAVALITVGLWAAPAAAQNCTTSGVHIIVARASTEQPGTGIIGSVARQVVAQVPGSDIVAVDYPATLTDYVNSESAGVVAMNKLVSSYAAACPRSRMVLMGYSQGAHVSADVVCGASEAGFPTTQPVSADIASKIVAVVLMGDPSFVPGLSWNKGNSTNNAVFIRANAATNCAPFASKMVSYCDAGDTYCDSGKDPAIGGPVHRGYVPEYGTDATNFVVSKAKSPATVPTGDANSVILSVGWIVATVATSVFALL